MPTKDTTSNINQEPTPVQEPAVSVEPTPTPEPSANIAPASSPTAQPVVAPSQAPISTNQSVTVYVTKTGTKYHRDGCRSLSKSKIPRNSVHCAMLF